MRKSTTRKRAYLVIGQVQTTGVVLITQVSANEVSEAVKLAYEDWEPLVGVDVIHAGPGRFGDNEYFEPQQETEPNVPSLAQV